VSGPLALAYPVLAQILLTFVMLLWMARVRLGAARAGRVRLGDLALSSAGWPDDVKKVANNAHNQFETPILFYVLCGLATAIGATGTLMVTLAWAWVASRVVHTAVHVTTNRIRHRFYAFVIGVTILMVMWGLLVIRLLASA
jgi:hypothetical protein